ncbi:uncharacterized protein LOC116033285 [Ipomoea triloba]|uniref:uncharacterized protein LOC116033285 n=1 Tax=Ipomoea triloba TaxID=35885 RepID=UPI00125CD866|nr:uncharacterized protein LOC116033285 [Ipomoea triloba]
MEKGNACCYPMYIAETSPSQIRGLLISLKEFLIVFGMLVIRLYSWQPYGGSCCWLAVYVWNCSCYKNSFTYFCLQDEHNLQSDDAVEFLAMFQPLSWLSLMSSLKNLA